MSPLEAEAFGFMCRAEEQKQEQIRPTDSAGKRLRCCTDVTGQTTQIHQSYECVK